MSLSHLNPHAAHPGFFNGMKEHGGGHYDLGQFNLTNKWNRKNIFNCNKYKSGLFWEFINITWLVKDRVCNT